MNKKIIALIIAVLVVAIGAYQFAYVPYMNEQAEISYNAGIKNASAMEFALEKELNETNKNSNASDLSTSISELKNTYENTVVPRVDEEIAKLNETRDYANGNETKIQYIDYQIERLQIEKNIVSDSIGKLDEMKVAFDSNDYLKVLSLSDEMTNLTKKYTDDLTPVKNNIVNLLNSDPEFNQTLQNLTLEQEFYGNIDLNLETL